MRGWIQRRGLKKRAAAATSRDRRCARHPTPFGILLVLLTSAASTPAALAGQDEAAIIRQVPRWSVEGSLGSRLVGTLYDDFVTRKTLADLPSQTRWKETASLGPEARVVLRHNPVGGAGLYLTLLAGHSGTMARYSGALSPPEEISRSTNYYGVGFGLGMKLSEWDRGRGLLAYNLGTVALTQTIDLSPGHRDAFAQMDARHPGEIEWTSRTSTSWGLDLGASLRVPIGENSALRFSFRDLVIPVNTAQLAAQERDDVKSISSERVAFSLAPFTAHQMSLSAGFEYVISWAPPAEGRGARSAGARRCRGSRPGGRGRPGNRGGRGYGAGRSLPSSSVSRWCRRTVSHGANWRCCRLRAPSSIPRSATRRWPISNVPST